MLISDFAVSQNITSPKDSTSHYKNNESFSVRSRFNKFFYRLLFKSVAAGSSDKRAKKKVYRRLIQKPYSAFEGKTIRNINIETLDPFGYSIGDTIPASLNIVTKAANKVHVKSQEITIRNLLLIRPNQLFDSLLVKESERLVRMRKYVTDVSFFVMATAKKSDSVDIFIRELDNWSIIPKVAASSSGMMLDLTDKNFLGSGQEFQNVFTRNYPGRNSSFNVNYAIPNISNTYIGTILHYGIDGRNSFNRSITVDRPFFSPFTKWAGGVSIQQRVRSDSIHTSDPYILLPQFKFNAQDLWVGNAMQIFKGNSENNRTTNFISALRYLRIRYPERPAYDPLNLFSNEDFYLAGLGISTRKYVQDKFVFNFGVPEDVPIGKVYGLTGGYQEKNSTGRFYLGARVSVGNYYPWGYLSANYEYGTFFRASHAEQGIFTAGVIYFTALLEAGRWKFRQFAKPQLTIGIKRYPSDSLTINDGYGLNGFNSIALKGTSRFLFSLQTQSYAPWNFIGFRFGPFINYTLGMLGDKTSGFKRSKVFTQIGLGVLIKNINLIINTFQISIAFYPMIPGVGQDILKFNTFNTRDFGFRDFESGKPSAMIFE